MGSRVRHHRVVRHRAGVLLLEQCRLLRRKDQRFQDVLPETSGLTHALCRLCRGFRGGDGRRRLERRRVSRPQRPAACGRENHRLVRDRMPGRLLPCFSRRLRPLRRVDDVGRGGGSGAGIAARLRADAHCRIHAVVRRGVRRRARRSRFSGAVAGGDRRGSQFTGSGVGPAQRLRRLDVSPGQSPVRPGAGPDSDPLGTQRTRGADAGIGGQPFADRPGDDERWRGPDAARPVRSRCRCWERVPGVPSGFWPARDSRRCALLPRDPGRRLADGDGRNGRPGRRVRRGGAAHLPRLAGRRRHPPVDPVRTDRRWRHRRQVPRVCHRLVAGAADPL